MVMLLTDNIKIQEVLLFPAMKPEETEVKEVKEVKEVTVEAKPEHKEKVKAQPKGGKGEAEKEGEATKTGATEAPSSEPTKTEAPATESTKTEAPAV